eukprot:Nk52_evm4s150 gene=Nk52_evmTU4s150
MPHCTCVLLAAGQVTRLEKELSADPRFDHLKRVPKALLPVGGEPILNRWWDIVRSRNSIDEVYLVVNANKYKHFERWATANDFPVKNIVNDGSTTENNRIGAISDLDLVCRIRNVNTDLLVIAADALFWPSFDLPNVISAFRAKPGSLIMCYELPETEPVNNRGIVWMDSNSGAVTRFLEKPSEEVMKNSSGNRKGSKQKQQGGGKQCDSRLASIVFYLLKKETIPLISQFVNERENEPASTKDCGRFMEWLVNNDHQQGKQEGAQHNHSHLHRVFGMRLPGSFGFMGQVGLHEYLEWNEKVAQGKRQRGNSLYTETDPVHTKAYARVGLMGNPSDGFFGKTISVSIENFWAEATMWDSEQLVILPNPVYDPTRFGGMSDLCNFGGREGYYGGQRLLLATCKRFLEYCNHKGIALPKRNFTLSYHTNIPRQVGLAGSSAIVTAVTRALMQFFSLQIDQEITKAELASFVLTVEVEELGINAGLQDRVIQAYGGMVYMDFAKEQMEKDGFGNYEPLDINLLPQLWLAYVADPSDSGKIHNNVRFRFDSGDQEVIDAMQKFGSFAEKTRNALLNRNYAVLDKMMRNNFELRRKIYGEECLGADNLRMVSIANQHGCPAKFTGSGGAIVGFCPTPEATKNIPAMRAMFESEGYVFIKLQAVPGF